MPFRLRHLQGCADYADLSCCAAGGMVHRGTSPCESCEISLVWHVMTLKGESQLGHFGFCTGVMAGGNQLFYFPWHQPYHFSTFGPTSARAFIEDFLGMLSGSARPGRKPEDLLEIGNDRPDSRFPADAILVASRPAVRSRFALATLAGSVYRGVSVYHRGRLKDPGLRVASLYPASGPLIRRPREKWN
jgi:hypothetical protein